MVSRPWQINAGVAGAGGAGRGQQRSVKNCYSPPSRVTRRRCILRGPEAIGPPLGSPEAALNMEALLLELSELNDQADALTEAMRFDEWWAVNERRREIARRLDEM